MANPLLSVVTPVGRAKRVLDTLVDHLSETKDAEQNAAERILRQARQNAASRPTPQARMVASGLLARRGVVIGFGSKRVFGRGAEQGVKMGLLAFGSEFGSTHRQFGRPWQGGSGAGYWLHPAAEQNPEMDDVQDEHVDDAIDAAERVSKLGF